MIYEEDKKALKKYRHILAAMIDRSIGYFTPLMALNALESHKEGRIFYCEWYAHIAGAGYKRVEDEDLLRIGREVISRSFENRKINRRRIKECLKIVDANIAGHESILASYF